MKSTLAATLFVALSPLPGYATDGLRTLDLNGDRFVSFAEVRAAYPDFTEVSFREIDANRDNRLSSVETHSAAARMALGRYEAFSIKAAASVDTDGGTAIHFLRTGGRLFWPTASRFPQGDGSLR